MVRAVTKLVQPHGVVLFPRADSDHEGIDRAMDDYATGDDIYSTDFEPPFGLAHVATSSFLAATEASSPPTAGPNPRCCRRALLCSAAGGNPCPVLKEHDHVERAVRRLHDRRCPA